MGEGEGEGGGSNLVNGWRDTRVYMATIGSYYDYGGGLPIFNRSQIVGQETKGFNYRSVSYTVRSFCLKVDEMM